MTSSKLSLTFRIFKGQTLINEVQLSQNVIKIGKVPSAHLFIDDESVSRMHAIVEVTNNEVSIIDLGSTRGTFINGHKVNKAKLQSGDSITLGETRVEVAIADAAPVAAVRNPDIQAAPVRLVPATAPVAYAASVRPPLPVAAQRPAPVVAMPAGTMTMPASVVMTPMATPVSPGAFQAAMAESVDDAGGARAVEVAAMLGESVVGVKHCMDPRGGKVTPATWGFIAGGIACLLASATAFYVSVDTAAYNKAALDYHTRVLHKPAYAFRPDTTNPAVGWLAFGGLAFGLGAVAAGLARARSERKSPFYRIGTAPGVEQPIENAPSESFPLVAPSGDDFVFNYGAGMDGELILDGKSTPLSELAATGRARPSMTTAGAIEIPIPPKARIRARAGQTTFLVSAVAQPKREATSMLAHLEGRTFKYVAGSLAVHLGILLVLNQIPLEETNVNLALADKEQLGQLAQIKAMDDKAPDEPEKSTETGDVADGSAQESMAMRLDQGKAGDPKVPNQDGGMRVKDNKVEPQLSREQEIEAARNAGIMGSTLLRDSISAMTATNDFSSGFDKENFYGPFDGTAGPGNGTFGMGRSGDGRGGGCFVEPCGLVGTGGRYRTIATGKYAGDGYWGANGGGGRMRTHTQSVPPVVGYPVTGGTGLDRAIIKRYIKRSEQKIAYCYERELLARPELEGTIASQFLIVADGTVASSNASGFDNAVASCVATVVKNISFPKPNDGSTVTVNYPFVFRRASK